MKTPQLFIWGVAMLWMVLVQAPALANGTSLNCSDGSCDEDEAPCPPDSVLELGPDGGPCVCATSRCVQPQCHYGSQKVLQRHGSDKPGDCCDVYECVQPKVQNCSEIVCPEDVECPSDSYRKPSYKGLSDCCMVRQECLCNPSPCLPAVCPEGEHAREVRAGSSKPGACCPLLECVRHDSNETCILDGKETKNGSEWWKDNCTLCMCDNGLLFCRSSPVCPEISQSCPATRIPEGECCPICSDDYPNADIPGGCVSASGKIMSNGATWQDDPCTACECTAGAKKCQAYMCEVTCVDPKYVADECCPICDATTVVTLPPHCPYFNNSCSLRCVHGFKRDAAGCITCQCQAEECTLECPSGYAQDTHGNKLCICAAVSPPLSPLPADCPPLTGCRKNCSHGFRLNKAGCEVCKCSQCRPINDCDKNCPHGFRINDRGCQICKCQGSVETHLPDESTQKTTTPYFDDEESCISSDGHMHHVGEAWFDGCRQCYCHASVEMCNLITCPVVKCKETVFNSSTDCCPRCADSAPILLRSEQKVMTCQSVDGAYRVEGETWQLNECTKCLCHSGRVLCEAKKCPPAACQHPITTPGQCCPHCPITETFSTGDPCGLERPHGATWRDGNCRSCACDSGSVTCFEEECSSAKKCDRPVLAKNWCCSVCLDQTAPKICEVGNMTYQELEKWTEDECTHCVCQGGAKYCTEKVCSVSCANPVNKPGKCCPVCAEETHSSLNTVAYLATISVLLGVVVILVLYIVRQCCIRRNQSVVINGASHYANYSTHTPPPQYASADRRDPYQYKYVQSYDSPQIDDLLKSPSIGTTEKMALAPV